MGAGQAGRCRTSLTLEFDGRELKPLGAPLAKTMPPVYCSISTETGRSEPCVGAVATSWAVRGAPRFPKGSLGHWDSAWFI